MEILCGERAWRYLSGTYDQAHAVGQHLSVKPLEAAAAVERLTEELTAAKARMAELGREVFSHKAHAYCGKGDVVLVEPLCGRMASGAWRTPWPGSAGTCGGIRRGRRPLQLCPGARRRGGHRPPW